MNECGPDGWLGALHMLLLMDDTVLFATSRQSMCKKLAILKRAADEIGMLIHPTKSRFMCIGATDCEKFVMDNVDISHTSKYVYLGTPISPNTLKEHVNEHLESKSGHVFKFTSFLVKNCDAPFSVKQTVWESALTSALFYSCETWLIEDFRAAESIFMCTLKNLLSVRSSTCNDLVLMEVGLADAKSFIRQRQSNYIHKLMARDNYANSIVAKVITLAIEERTKSGEVLKNLIDKGPNHDFVAESKLCIRNKIRSSTSTRRTTYCSINPELTSPKIYSSDIPIQEHHRIACTRLRLSSHRLKVETGRWSRIPVENRLCDCGLVQSEEHVLLKCPLTTQLRTDYDISSINTLDELFSERDNAQICAFCYHVLQLFK